MHTGKHLGDISVLLVDDDVDVREFLAMALEQEGMKVTQVIDAESGIEALKTGHFDCVTTDKNMPGMDGVSFIKYIRENYGELPVILITGQSSVKSAIDAFKLGAQDYLVKPLQDGEELVGSIWRAVDHHRLGLQHRILQERLIRAQRLESLGILAGGVAHDLNNILCPMLAFPQLIIRQVERLVRDIGLDKPEMKNELDAMDANTRKLKEAVDEILEELRQMEDSGKRAAQVVQDLLSLSISGHFEKAPVNVNNVIRDHLKSPELVERRMTRPDLMIETKLGKDLPWIAGSAPHVNRVISNLVKNAIEAVDKHRKDEPGCPATVTVRTTNIMVQVPVMGYEVIEPGEYVLLEVTDTGIGIEEDKIQKIFEPFFTTKKMSSTTGSGLGLAIVRGIIKDHNGYIDVKSVIGTGSTFFVYLPLSDEQAPAAPAPEPAVEVAAPATPSAKGGEHILVVDDEPAARFVAKRLLTMLGYKVTTANSGGEATQIIDKAKQGGVGHPFDLIMLDMIMGEGSDGLETYKKIMELCPGQKTVLVSGYSVTEKAKEMMDLGAACLPKPYSMKDLSKVIREVLDGVKAG